MRARGRTHAAPSEHKWAAGWQTPPVICPTCNGRVTLKDAFYGSHTHGTYHATPECLPYTVKVTCGRRPLRVASVKDGAA